jgi:hypothetical protein
MKTARDILRALSFPDRDAHELPSSSKRFSDGGEYRVEIPSCEGPKAMQAVIAEAASRNVTVHRVSQGSGIMLQTDAEISEMLTLGRANGIEVCLFVGPRANWDVGVQASSSGGACSVRRSAAPISWRMASKTSCMAPHWDCDRSSWPISVSCGFWEK